MPFLISIHIDIKDHKEYLEFSKKLNKMVEGIFLVLFIDHLINIENIVRNSILPYLGISAFPILRLKVASLKGSLDHLH